MSDSTNNPMDRDYAPYGPGGRTNAEIWEDAADRMEAERNMDLARSSQRTSGDDYRSSPEVDDQSRFRGALAVLIVGGVALGYANTLNGDSRQMVGVMALTAIGLSVLSLAGLLIKHAVRRVTAMMNPATIVVVILVLIYIFSQKK